MKLAEGLWYIANLYFLYVYQSLDCNVSCEIGNDLLWRFTPYSHILRKEHNLFLKICDFALVVLSFAFQLL